ncbi:MAG: DUF3575 domain-containing protein [Bacteroidota bacterium]
MRIKHLLSLCFCFLLLGLSSLQAQQNVLKLNLPNLPSRHFALHYERALDNNMSVGVIVGLTPNRDLPGANLLKNWIFENPDSISFDFSGTYSKFAITPEFRYYLQSQRYDSPVGIYLAAAFRYSLHNFEIPFTFTEDNGNPLTVTFDGRLQNIGGTLGIGVQFFLAERIAIDIYSGLGAAFTPVRLQASSNALTSDDYIKIRDQFLDEIGVDIDPSRVEEWVANRDLNIRFPIYLPLVRTGLSIGYRF